MRWRRSPKSIKRRWRFQYDPVIDHFPLKEKQNQDKEGAEKIDEHSGKTPEKIVEQIGYRDPGRKIEALPVIIGTHFLTVTESIARFLKGELLVKTAAFASHEIEIPGLNKIE